MPVSLSNDFTFRERTEGFNLISYWKQNLVSRAIIVSLASILIMQAIYSTMVVRGYLSYYSSSNDELIQAVNFLNSHSSPNSVIETYDSEAFFLLDRPYHYPPDQLHLDLINSRIGRLDAKPNYDLLQSNPDFLLIGYWSREIFPLYDETIIAKEFDPIATFGQFKVFKRINNQYYDNAR